jgi:hypothetical protein
VSLPKNIERSKGQSSKEWAEDLAKKGSQSHSYAIQPGEKG